MEVTISRQVVSRIAADKYLSIVECDAILHQFEVVRDDWQVVGWLVINSCVHPARQDGILTCGIDLDQNVI